MENNITIKSQIIVVNRTNAKSTFCLEDGRAFNSIIKTSKAYNVSPSRISETCSGITKICQGKRFFYLDELPYHIDEICEYINKLKVKADKYDKLIFSKREKEIMHELSRHQQQLDECNKMAKGIAKNIKMLEKELKQNQYYM